jgi:transposase
MKTNINSQNRSSATEITQADIIKLGVDVHAEKLVVVRIVDNSTPQPPQRFTREQFMTWVEKQRQLAKQVFSCYEAGPFGYSLHRELEQRGVTNYVVRPRDWDEYGQKVKTDQRDARQLALELDRYVRGNSAALCVVRVPTPQEEQRRSRARQRQTLLREKLRLAAQGRSHGLYYGHRLQYEWWKESRWRIYTETCPAFLMELLAPLRRLIEAIETELSQREKELHAPFPVPLPTGLGQLTAHLLEREIGDWNRFHNRRQVASYTGMCPREHSSGQKRAQGHISKHGNRRLRPLLVECSWRLCQFQPGYRPIKQWRHILSDPKVARSRRKQLAVAIGRRFAVDWWRIRTGQCTPEKLGLTLKPLLAAKS